MKSDSNEMKFRVLVNLTSINKCNVGDILEINGEMKVVTCISKKYVYIDGKPYHRKKMNKLKREFIKEYRRGKSIASSW